VRDVASEVHRLAHQLHPAKLDQLGFVTAARGWCRDLARQTGLAIEFVADHVPTGLPSDVGLCLYRIVQESLQNVVRHSGSPSARVSVSAGGTGLRLVVTDAGRGFDTASGRSAGLGLVSMRERVRLLGGTMALRSHPGAGTEIEVTIPVEAARSARCHDEPGMMNGEKSQTGFTG
jgi:signal transduction histidine kinase